MVRPDPEHDRQVAGRRVGDGMDVDDPDGRLDSELDRQQDPAVGMQPAGVVPTLSLVAMRDLLEQQAVHRVVAGATTRTATGGSPPGAMCSVMSSSNGVSPLSWVPASAPPTQTRRPVVDGTEAQQDAMALVMGAGTRSVVQYQAIPTASGKTCWMMPGTGAGSASGRAAACQPSRRRHRQDPERATNRLRLPCLTGLIP